MRLQYDWDQGQDYFTESESRRKLSFNAPPLTSFPGLSQLEEASTADLDSSSSSVPTTPTESGVSLEDRLKPLLIVSDTAECNNNLSCYLKEAVDELYGIQDVPSVSAGGEKEEGPTKQNYQRISLFSLRLITLNLFVKNQSLCIGKLLSLLAVLGQTSCSDDETRYEGECLKEFICITILLILKSANNYDKQESQGLLLMLEDLNFVGIIFGFLISHINNINNSSSSYKILKFVCDIVFEYLYQVEHLSDNEFQILSLETSLIPTIIKTLFDNDSFNNYDIDEDNEGGIDESKVIAYEEFKLLLLLNEQYLMKSYTKPEIENKVFTSLLEQLGSSGSNISGFINMVVCYLNREESQILKILMLKFLYLIFTTSYTSKLFYLNDLKILVDIFIRELNNMDFSGSIEAANENRLLTITYLKVMYPLLMFSQLNELEGGYKNEEIIELFSYLIVNCKSSGNGDEATDIKSIQDEQNEVISKLAVRCLSVNWLKKSNNNSPIPKNSIPISNNPGSVRDRDMTRQSNNNNNNSSSLSSSVTLNSSLTYKPRPGLYHGLTNSSQESIGAAFTRIASVRTSNKNDIHRTTTLHNLSTSGKEATTTVLQNNNNVFLAKMNSLLVKDEKELDENCNILNLPKEYLVDKKSTLTYSSLIRKAIMKKAPPPPSTSPSPRNSNYSPNNHSRSSTPINTPPPNPIPSSRLNAALPALPFPPPPPPPRRRR